MRKMELVVTMLREVVAAGYPAAYLVGDTIYIGGCVRKAAGRLGVTWVGTLAPAPPSCTGASARRCGTWQARSG
jgi:hypothetical protein